jgi:phage terminase large subunit-like protein
MAHPRRWTALVARTPADARDYMIEGPGGILRNAPPGERPNFEPSKRRLTWPNGSWATIFSDDEPDQCRGFSGDTAWLDEFAKFQNPQESWNNLAFGMREASSDQPRRLITTTPRPIPVLIQIERMPTTVVVTGSSYENEDNLDPRWFTDVVSVYEGTRIGRQEIMAEILDDVPGALWTRAMLDDARLPDLEAVEVRRAAASLAGAGQLGLVGVWTGATAA